VNDVSEINVSGLAVFPFKVVDIDSEIKLDRVAGTRHGIMSMAGTVSRQNLAEFFSIVSDGNDVGDVLVLEKCEDVVGIESAIKTENRDMQVKVSDDRKKLLEVFGFLNTAFHREYGKGQPMSCCDNGERDIRVECGGRIFLSAFYDIVAVGFNDGAIIWIIGEIDGEMIRFAGFEDSILGI
jgi:hypothetical protein